MMPSYWYSRDKGKCISHRDYAALLLFAEKRGDRGTAIEALSLYDVTISDEKPRTPDILVALYEYVADETAQFV